MRLAQITARSLGLAVTSLGIGLFSLLGCASDTRQVDAPPPHPAQPAAAAQNAAAAPSPAPSLESLRSDLSESKNQIDAALASLTRLTDPKTPQTELRPTYDAYADQLARITQHSEKLKREAEAMRASKAEYFAKWDQKAEQIDNPSIRASADARRARMRAGYERITEASLAAKEAYQPFMKDLQDVRRYLGAELSRDNATMLEGVSRKANADGVTVKQKIDTVIAELDAVNGAG